MVSPEKRRGPGLRTPGARQNIRDDGHRQGTAEKTLEALTFAAAARGWLDHGIGGDIPIGEAAHAAKVLLERVGRLAA